MKQEFQTPDFPKMRDEVSRLANGKFYIVTYEPGVHDTGSTYEKFSAYIRGIGWTSCFPTWAECLKAMKAKVREAKK